MAAARWSSDSAEPHSHLTSLLDPERVTEMEFVEQERRLAAMVKRRGGEDFREELTGRLGSAQARALASKYYRRAL